jgi:hypothetical protein
MANSDKKFDQYFQEKLGNHEVKPSKLAWERLDSQLGKKGKAAYYPFIRIAAAIILLMGAGYLVWQFKTAEITRPQTAEIIQIPVQEEVLDNKTESLTEQEITNEIKSEFVNPESIENEKAHDTPVKKPRIEIKPVTERPKELLAENTIQTERNHEQMIGIPELDLPELKLEEAIGMKNTEKQDDEEVLEYKVIIKSKGLKNEPTKQSLIVGIEEKVDKIGGFLNKVEQGFADLQDAKENLFASNLPRKERSK